jgi:hypothetical protein
MITAYFRDEEGNTLTIDAPTFAKAYQQAVDQGFYVYDYDTEEWDDMNTIDVTKYEAKAGDEDSFSNLD